MPSERKTMTLDIKTADVIFDVEQEGHLSPNTNLPDVFPTDDLPAFSEGIQNKAFDANAVSMNLDGENIQTLGRTMTMHSRKPLVGADTLPNDETGKITKAYVTIIYM